MSKCRDLIHAQSFILYIYISYKRINNIGDKLLWLYMFLTIDQSPNLFASLFLFYFLKEILIIILIYLSCMIIIWYIGCKIYH